MLPLGLKFYLVRLNEAAAPILPRVDGQIATRPFRAGERFTAADIQMSCPMETYLARGGLDARYPSTLSYVARVKSRPAYRRAEERGGPASAVRWHPPAHFRGYAGLALRYKARLAL